MSAIAFSIVGCRPAAPAAAPAFLFRLRVEHAGPGRIHAMLLRCHPHIEPRGRQYSANEAARLFELFGERSGWDRSLRPVPWTQTAVAVPSFDRCVEVDVPVPCTYDLEVASAKYFHAVRDGEVPLVVLFTGTVFHAGGESFRVEPISWDAEARYRMPASVWHETMATFFPGGAWIRIERETLEALQVFRGRQAYTSWDAAIRALLGRGVTREPV